ncbi:tRNA 2-thiouridine(34) synthase MnmA [Hymenobacter sp. 15J16-1T3B]|uniref:tRNA 2-thiouridine(34) synthase MnmA n=1 Tax=Hymenobacter sp. 15J16-1T3B TaxID=2886941 RepID=UPI001D1117B1|nr:tRNA 2-thiouridine(34) synthase MnmA [Hymenobacter sp. 15J16-1T3B]MCC3159082.1 tRNA 2-thiouridine(34) synthase MnmA [Hymenobacter sp. 15J16-1T3B]
MTVETTPGAGSKGRVLVAMSGGIDSSVAAVLLHEQGYEVVGMTMKTWDYASAGGSKKETGCCSLDSINDARDVAVQLGFPHFIIDIRNEFGGHVIDDFVEGYLAGRTPNPCVLCNTHIKWDALLRRADQLGCQYIATGHYAQVREENGRYVITKGLDEGKDQSYALWGVSQESLARTIFPLGQLRKSEIRQLATDRGFMELVNKPESYEICFIPDNDYRGFLKRRVEGLEERVAGGKFVLTDGSVVGAHEGYPFYTIGQRKGLGVTLGYPAYVVEIRPETNEVVLGNFDELARTATVVGRLNMGKHASLAGRGLVPAVTKVRYNHGGAASFLEEKDGKMYVYFPEPVHAIAPGQAAVFYDGLDVLGGGWIERSPAGLTAPSLPVVGRAGVPA